MQPVKTHFILIIILGLLFSIGCATKKSKIDYPTPPGYNFSAPIIIKLKSELDEISGLFYYPKDTSVFAIIDEAGYLYKIFLRKNIEIEKWKFSKKADYEDVQLVDSTFYALNSNGSITSFNFLHADSVEAEVEKGPFEGKNEFEILYYDDVKTQLVLLCKDCKVDKKNSLTAFAFNPKTKRFHKSPTYILDVEKIAGKLGLDKMKLKPSAAAINPVTKELFIVSAINKALIIADRNGVVKEAYPLDPILFKQPEGLTFTPTGDLLISNEAAEAGSPNILIFKYKEPIDEKN